MGINRIVQRNKIEAQGTTKEFKRFQSLRMFQAFKKLIKKSKEEKVKQ